MVVSNKQGDFFVPLTKKLVKLYSNVLPYRRMALSLITLLDVILRATILRNFLLKKNKNKI